MWCGPALGPSARVAVEVAVGVRRRRARKARVTPESVTRESSLADVREATRQYDLAHPNYSDEMWWNSMPFELFCALIRYRKQIEAEVAAEDQAASARP